jgi:serine/threonine protein kinase
MKRISSMNAIDRDDGLSTCARLDTPHMVAALEVYQEALRAGRRVDRAEFLAAHPEVADQLSEYLRALEMIQSVAGEMTPSDRPEDDRSPLGTGDLLGDFRILREVGRGGMGVVYEAVQLGLPDRRVALKVLPVSSSLDPRTLQRFRVETQAAACLNHPNIVPVFSAGCEQGVPFYAMPLIKGRSLAEILRTLRSDDKAPVLTPLPSVAGKGLVTPWPVMVAHLGLQAAEALGHAHSLGVIHRDIKPSNLIIDDDWNLWVTDFGLARIACNDTGLTSTGDLVGTLRYMSPEQIRGEPGAGDARADIYALGVTLYEAVTLRPVFEACDRSALMHHILNDEPPPPRSIDPAVPKDLETIILKAMDKLPAGRYATARDLADDLHRFLDDRPIRARRPTLVERSLRWARRHRALLATAVAGIVLSMAIGTFMLWRTKQQLEANLTKVRDARNREHVAFERAIGINDAITVPLLREAAAAGIWDEGRRLQSYQTLILFYDEVARTFTPGDPQVEVVAKAARRAGALRMTLGDRRGLEHFARAVDLYEAMSARSPRMIWYRTDLISTLREYAGLLERLGDRWVGPARRRACEVAEGLLGDADAKLPCFRTGIISEFRALIEMLAHDPAATAADPSLADRLRRWIDENPAPRGPFIYLPRP